VAAVLCGGCSRRPSDDAISAQIRAAFFSDSEVKKQAVAVEVKQGRVTLSGVVDGVEAELKAVQIATNTGGVLAVRDDMSVAAISAPVTASVSVPGQPVMAPKAVSPAPSASTNGGSESFEVAGTEPPGQVLDVEQAVESQQRASEPAASEPDASEELPAAAPEVSPPGDAPQQVEPQMEQPATRAEPAAASHPRSSTPAYSRRTLTLMGAGPASIASLAEKWFSEFSAPDGLNFKYQAVGSAAGLRRLMQGGADFGATDILTPKVDNGLYFPAALTAVRVICNIASTNGRRRRILRLDGTTLGAIYLGKITRWNDPLLAGLNRGIELPDSEITVIHRSDWGASTEVFRDYLARWNPEWQKRIGAGPSARWPVGQGAEGDDGVEDLLLRNAGSIGYVEKDSAHGRLTYTQLKNHAGNFVPAEAEFLTSAAASAAGSMPPDFRVSLTDAPGANAYPMASITWIVVPRRDGDSDKRRAITGFLDWMLVQGQATTARLGYAPLPKEFIAREVKQVNLLR
jgi:phosphate transport system substrate-binding protein